jgi:carbon storage regulator CsrA
MLVINRKLGQDIDITLEDRRRITITLMAWERNQARIGIEAPRTITIDRHEVTERKEAEDRID